MTEAELVEALARALAAAEGVDPNGDPNEMLDGTRTNVAYPTSARLWWRYTRHAYTVMATLGKLRLVIVPREPTEAMLNAESDPTDRSFTMGPQRDISPRDCRTVWRAMVAAALAERAGVGGVEQDGKTVEPDAAAAEHDGDRE